MRPTDVDRALAALTPVVPVPLYGEFVPMQDPGHRFLVCGDGLWVECRRAWLHALLPLARPEHPTAMPFGTVRRTITFGFERLPMWALRRFLELARSHHPKEVGALLTWREGTGAFAYRECEVVDQSGAHLRQRMPALGLDEHVVLDLHSHGRFGAGFSQTDRRDMGMDALIAGVVGKLDQEQPEWVLSLFVCGAELPCVLPAFDLPEAAAKEAVKEELAWG